MKEEKIPMCDNNDYEALLEKAKNGDAIAIAEIYRKVHPVVLRYFKTQLNPQHDAEMIASKCMEALFKNLNHVESVEPYINKTRISRLINFIRSRGFRQGKSTTSIHGELPGTDGLTHEDILPVNAPSALDSLIDKERNTDIENAMNELNPKYAEPLRLKIIGFSYKDIACMLNMSKNTVASRIFKARNMLKNNPKVKCHYDDMHACR